jgi:NAD(P)-dependent dehydrogenase (short-subunit alcohol dehydrogenase family)
MTDDGISLQPRLRGRVAVVTGGSGVLGGAMARELARHGVAVAVVGRSVEKAAGVAEAIVAAGGAACAFACDVLDPSSVERLVASVTDALGAPHILVNAAGGGGAAGSTDAETASAAALADPAVRTMFDITPEGFRALVDLNLTGTWLPTSAFARTMVGRTGATIVNVSSMTATAPATRVPAYSAGKAGIDSITKWLAVHLADAGIRVNAIAPGFFLTEQNRRMLTRDDGTPTPRAEKIIAGTPMRRLGDPEELLGTLLWLADETRSGFVTGAIIPVDGGFLAYSGV